MSSKVFTLSDTISPAVYQSFKDANQLLENTKRPLSYLFDLERHRPAAALRTLRSYERQENLSVDNRPIIVEWIIGCAHDYNWHTETMCLAIGIFDRLAGFIPIPVKSAQATAGICLMLAAKYVEEQYHTSNVVKKASRLYGLREYSQTSLFDAERIALETLRYDLSTIVTYRHFIGPFMHYGGVRSSHLYECYYLLGLALIESDMLPFLPSTVAAAIVYICRDMARHVPTWTGTLIVITRHTTIELKSAITTLVRLARAQASLSPEKRHYTLEGYLNNASQPLLKYFSS